MRSILSALAIVGVAALFVRDISASVFADHMAFLSLGDVLGLGGVLGRIWVFALAAIIAALVLALPHRRDAHAPEGQAE